MKNLRTTLLFIILTTTSLWAQKPEEVSKTTQKTDIVIPMSAGSWFLGMNGTGGFGRGVAGNTNILNVTGQGGYFVANRLVAGLQFTYGRFHSTHPISSSSFFPGPPLERNEFVFTPELFARYYFTSWKVKPFAQLSAGWSFQKGDVRYTSGEVTGVSADGFTAAAGLGLSFRVSKRVNIDLMYNKGLVRTQNFGTPSGLRLGVTFLLNKR